MNFVDIIILAVVLILLGLIVYFSFIRKKNGECSNCPHSKSCDKRKRKKDEKTVSEKECNGDCAACAHRESQPPSDSSEK